MQRVNLDKLEDYIVIRLKQGASLTPETVRELDANLSDGVYALWSDKEGSILAFVFEKSIWNQQQAVTWVRKARQKDKAMASTVHWRRSIALGGPGSGNWAHDGRPGKVGGSQEGGGLQRINARPSDPAAKRRKLATVHKQTKGADLGKGEGVKTQAFANDPNQRYEFQWRVVPMSTLIPSNTSSGAINPDYTKELQPRDRSRQASQVQIDNVARNLTPEALLWDFHQLDKGAPIVGEDMMVESGNGRTLALQRAKAMYPEQYAAYKERMADVAREYGISESDIANIENPVLVRVRKSDVDRVKFAQEANSAAVLQMSPLEQAKVDADKIDTTWLSNFQIKDGQSIDQALRHSSNAAFVKNFLGEMPANEAAVLKRSNGDLNRMGIWRMKAAMFSKVFPGEAGQRLADTFLESLDSNIKNFENAISDIMPKMAQAEGLIASGQRGQNLSMAGDFSKAIDMLARLKETGMSIPDYIKQASLFERETTPRQERIMQALDKITRSRKQIREMMERYADAVINSPNPQQAGMFGDEQLTEDALLAIILQGLE